MRAGIGKQNVIILIILLNFISSGESRGAEEVAEKAARREPHFVTGLELSLIYDEERLFGPGLMWGLILIQKKLELELSIHSMIGGNLNYTNFTNFSIL